MARRKKSEAVDLDQAHELTAGLIEALTCPEGKLQAFLRDTKAPGLRVRVTAGGAKSYVFEAKLKGKTIRRTIGDARARSIEEARKKANALRVRLDAGEDPRATERAKAEEERQALAQRQQEQETATARAVTVGDLWPDYLRTGKPKRRDAWKPRYLQDLHRMSAPGGTPKKGGGTTRPGPLHPLMALALVDISEDTLSAWMDAEAQHGKHQAARALMMFRGFLRWCAIKPAYRGLVDKDAGRAPALLENLPTMTRRTDYLEDAQVSGWWSAVEQLDNRTASVYLRALLLTGARREEMAGLKWADVDFQWRKLTLADKVEKTRTIPLTPYLAQLLGTLPRRNEWVFASTRDLKQDPANAKRRERDAAETGRPAPAGAVSTLSASGRMSDPRSQHSKALKAANIEGLTIHGLRRSFSIHGEAAGAPAGAIAQVMGHKPSATAEGYRPRSPDALRPFLTQIEAHLLALAGVQFTEAVEPGKLTLVTAA